MGDGSRRSVCAANFPSATTTFGRIAAIWARRNGSHASISAGSGFRLPGRAALHDVRDVDVRAAEAHGLDHLREELPRAPDERLSLKVLVLAGALPDEHELGARVPHAEDELRPAAGELAAGALAELDARPRAARRSRSLGPTGSTVPAAPRPVAVSAPTGAAGGAVGAAARSGRAMAGGPGWRGRGRGSLDRRPGHRGAPRGISRIPASTSQARWRRSSSATSACPHGALALAHAAISSATRTSRCDGPVPEPTIRTDASTRAPAPHADPDRDRDRRPAGPVRGAGVGAARAPQLLGAGAHGDRDRRSRRSATSSRTSATSSCTARSRRTSSSARTWRGTCTTVTTGASASTCSSTRRRAASSRSRSASSRTSPRTPSPTTTTSRSRRSSRTTSETRSTPTGSSATTSGWTGTSRGSRAR